ncbi:MAG: hypothetical protein AB7I27_06685 [Bacteriovoracaceae bacterium]
MKFASHFLFLLALVSCGKSANSNKAAPKPITEKNINGLSINSLNGTKYETSCVKAPGVSNLKADHAFKIFQKENKTFFEWSVWFKTNDCRLALSEFKITGTGDFEDKSLKKFDGEVLSAHIMSLQYEITDAFNKNKQCGFDIWKTYDYQDVLHTDCVKSPQLRLYFNHQDKDILLYSCNQNEDLSEKCDKVELKPTSQDSMQ